MVRYWPKADTTSCTAHVRFRGQSGHRPELSQCPLMTESGHPAVDADARICIGLSMVVNRRKRATCSDAVKADSR